MRRTGIRRDSGFTLIELLIVITIIGILAGIAIPGLLNAMDKAKQVATASLLRGAGEANEIYIGDNGHYPLVATIDELMVFLKPLSDSLRAKDEWKHALFYEHSTDGNHYSITSYGKDGIPGLPVSPETRYNFSLDIIFSDGTFTAGIE